MANKAALVTGGGTGIGAAVVLALAKAGYDVAINYSRSEGPAKAVAAQAEKAGVKAITIKCDVSNDKSVRAMLAEVEKTFGRLDVLVNNAGTTADWKPRDLESISEEAWDNVFAVNTKSIFLVTRAAVKLLKASKGSFIFLSSIIPLQSNAQR